MDFDPETALRYAAAISRPRLVGSGEEETVARQIAAQLESFGCCVEREPFRFTRAFDIALALEIGLALALIAFALALRNAAPIFAILLLALLAAAPPLNRAIHRRAVAPEEGSQDSPLSALGLRMGRLYPTANIIAHFPRLADADHPTASAQPPNHPTT